MSDSSPSTSSTLNADSRGTAAVPPILRVFTMLNVFSMKIVQCSVPLDLILRPGVLKFSSSSFFSLCVCLSVCLSVSLSRHTHTHTNTLPYTRRVQRLTHYLSLIHI